MDQQHVRAPTAPAVNSSLVSTTYLSGSQLPVSPAPGVWLLLDMGLIFSNKCGCHCLGKAGLFSCQFLLYAQASSKLRATHSAMK